MPYQTLTNEELYKKMKNAKQTISYSFSLFDNVEMSFSEYWRLVDLREFIDLDKFPYNASEKRETAPNWSNVYTILKRFTPGEIYDAIANKDKWIRDHIRKSDNQGYELSRYLSWQVMKYSDQYQNTSFQQAYFLCPNDDFPEVEQIATKLDRIKLRTRVSETQKQFNGIIHRLKADYRQTFNDMYTALFQNPTPTSNFGDKPVAEYMNTALLAIYDKTLRSIINRWNNYCSNQNETYFRNVIAQEMSNVRKNIPGGHPEQYLTRTTVAKTFDEIQGIEKEFIKNYSTVKNR